MLANAQQRKLLVAFVAAAPWLQLLLLRRWGANWHHHLALSAGLPLGGATFLLFLLLGIPQFLGALPAEATAPALQTAACRQEAQQPGEEGGGQGEEAGSQAQVSRRRQPGQASQVGAVTENGERDGGEAPTDSTSSFYVEGTMYNVAVMFHDGMHMYKVSLVQWGEGEALPGLGWLAGPGWLNSVSRCGCGTVGACSPGQGQQGYKEGPALWEARPFRSSTACFSCAWMWQQS